MKRIESVNDFVIKFANVNGTGSASANNLFAKALFRMGVPVSPKNIFPSNIQGLPTWYEVRVNDKGYLGRRGGIDIALSVNPQSMAQDIREVEPGGYFIYDDTKPMDVRMHRNDINIIGLPLTRICNEQYDDPRQRQLFKNVIYVGALAALLDMDFKVLTALVEDQFKGKKQLVLPNIHALELGHQYARTNLDCPIGIRVKKSDKVGDKILLDGNTALGLGALYGGATVAAWYPITPSTSVVDAFEKYAKRVRIDPGTGSRNYAIVQAEDELSAIGMAIGASWNGARSFTATSGPGVSLMSEFLGLAYFAEIPTVLFNVQRAGPSTGMPTRTQQADILACAYASHGDTKQVLLFPSTPKECFDFGALSFDLAERLQTPIIVMTDLDLGMNDNMSEPLVWDDTRKYDRGKVLTAQQLEDGVEFGRYLDVDGDAICYRTYPGTHPTKGAFFTRGTSRNEYAIYTEKGEEYEANMLRLLRKWDTINEYVPAPIISDCGRPTDTAVLYFGTSDESSREALDHLAEEGIYMNAMRVRAFPFNQEVQNFIEKHKRVFVIEQNRDAQLRTLLMAEFEFGPDKLKSVLCFDGSPISARNIRKQIKKHLNGDNVLPLHRHTAKMRARRINMSYQVPKFRHPELPVNELGYTKADYEGAISTLCAGCGHDSISGAIVRACHELSIEPHKIAKLSGIGCSSKAPTYFLGKSHGFNSVHGRMPSVVTGAALANRDLLYMGISGDGDTASIGMGQFAHVARRNLNMVYIVMNNGCYGLTKGQDSATADRGSASKKGDPNLYSSIDLCGTALQMGATFVARSFSGDKEQLVPLIKAAISHRGFALIDVVSPCVTFNNNSKSTKSYEFVREHSEATGTIDFVPLRKEITTEYQPGHSHEVTMHDGSSIHLYKADESLNPFDRRSAMATMEEHRYSGNILTGLIYMSLDSRDLHEVLETSQRPLNSLDESDLCPGNKMLVNINASLR